MNQELFSITCDTCASRLKVRQLSALGQILACPKCGSMIQIEAPEGWVPPEIQSQVTEDHELAELREPSSQPHPDSLKPQRQVVVGQSANKAKTKAAEKQSANAKPGKPGPPQPKPGQQPVLPNDQWTHQSARKKQKLVLLICSAAGVLIAILSVVGFLIARTANQNQADPIAKSDQDKTKIVDQPSDKKDDPSGKHGDKNTGNKKNGKDKATGKADGKKSDEKSGDGKVAGKDKEKEKAPVVNGKDTKDDGKKQHVNPDNPKLIGSPSGKGKGGKTSSGKTKDGKGKSTKGTGGPAIVENATIENDESILDKLGTLGTLMKNDTSDLRADAFNIDFERKIGIGSLYIPKPNRMEIKVDAWLDDRIPEIEIDSMPLSQFLRNLSILSNIPIKLDVDALVYHQLDSRAEVKFSGKDQSIEEILTAAIQPLKLTFEKKPWGLLVLPADIDQLIEREYEIFEFDSKDDKDYEELATFLKNRFAPKSWLENGGQGDMVRKGRSFKVKQTAKVHFWLNRYFSRVNACRKLALDKSKKDGGKELHTELQASASSLAVSSEINIIVAQPIRSVFQKLEKESGLVIIVDWPALMEAGWNPKTEIPWESNGAPLKKTLDEIMRSMKLAYRVVDKQTIQITTVEKSNQTLSLEIYPCAKIITKMTEVHLRNQVSAAFGDQVNKSMGMSAMYYSPGQCIVAVLPQPLHQRLQRILELMEE